MVRRPLDGSRTIKGDTASHALYEVGPATDYGADMREVIRAPLTGSVTRWWSGTGGNSVGVASARWRFIVQHLSAYAGGTGRVKEGSVIGYVGSTGSSTTGPHVHGFVIDRWTGKRYSVEEWLVKFFGFTTAKLWGKVSGPYKYGASTATIGDGITPFPIAKASDNDMMFIKHPTQQVWFLFWGDYGQDQTTNQKVADQWKDIAGRDSSREVTADWITAEKARRVAAYETSINDIANKVLAGLGGSGGTSTVDLSPVLAKFDSIPTAVQNGEETVKAIAAQYSKE